MSLDDFMESVGTQDWYQIRIFTFFCLQSICLAWFNTEQKYFFADMEFSCPNEFEKLEPYTSSCLKFMCYQKEHNSDVFNYRKYITNNSYHSVTQDFDLYCGMDGIRLNILQIQAAFSFVGLIIFGHLSDNVGRKDSLKTCWKIFTIGNFIYPFVKVLPLFIIGYMITSFACMSAVVIQTALINEQTSKRAPGFVLAPCALSISRSPACPSARAFLRPPVLCARNLVLSFFRRR